jgi:hypothetical protein
LADFFDEIRDDDDAFAETAAAAGDDGDFGVEFALGHGWLNVGWVLWVVEA